MPGSTFINNAGALRSGWRFALFVVAYSLFSIVAAMVLSLLLALAREPFVLLIDAGVDVELFLNAMAHSLAAVAALCFLAKFVERKPASTFIGFAGWPRNFAIGLAMGAGMVLLLYAGLALFSAIRVQWAPSLTVQILFIAATFAIAAIYEELLFRGYPMQVLAEGIGRWPAAAVMSALFGLLHLGNPHASVIGIINTVIAGLMLSAAFFNVRSLWLPFGIHLAWNASLGLVLGLSVSGLDQASIWKSTADGAPILTGGFYGPEGGILCTLVFLAGLVAMKRLRLERQNLNTQ